MSRACREKQGRPISAAGLLAALLALCLLAPACGNPPPSKAAREFADDTERHLRLITPILSPLVAQGKKEKLRMALEGIFAQAAKQGKPLTFGVALLDKKGIYLLGRYPKQGKPAGVEDVTSGRQDYSSYRSVKRCLDSRKVTQDTLYWENLEYHAICVPLLKNRRAVGVAILVFSGHVFKHYPGLTEKDFLRLKLDVPKS